VYGKCVEDAYWNQVCQCDRGYTGKDCNWSISDDSL
jgi:hypothetical protein